MCLAVYLASSIPLPISEWDKQRPAFYLDETSETQDMLVGARFSLRNVYFAGSHEGCGCGFLKDGEDEEDFERCQANYVALANLLDAILKQGGQAELFICWEGDQSKPVVYDETLTPAQIRAPEFQFKELQFIRVV